VDRPSSSAAAARIWAWSLERFPAVNLITSYLLYFLAASAVRHELGVSPRPTSMDVLFGLAIALHFLVLRVLDEHKDFAHDKHFHPERILQSGVVTLRELKILGSIAAVGSLIITLAQGSRAALAAWVMMMIWTGLMSVEFFCSTWIKKRFFLYSLTHMLILPLMVIWAAALANPEALKTAILPWLAFLSFFNGMIYELLRKTKGPDEELEGDPTFSSLWGRPRAIGVAVGFHLISFTLFILTTVRYFPLAASWLYFMAAFIGLFLSVATLAKFLKQPSHKSRKANEGASALYVLLVYVSLISFAFMA
jgi:4-hydroxybenzoate polyprenyltransferase